MPKLKKFSKKNKLSTKNILISFAIIIGLLTIGYISKSYAIYKLEKKYDLIQSKIGAYSTGDVKVAVLVDGKETDTFPSYETNYKVESIDCTNGVTATFDVENWQLNIADMSATSTKCTVSFNSKEKNEVTPLNYTKTELVALNEEIKNTSAKELADYLYPVGSIYLSTTDSSVDDVVAKFGGTWVRYGEDTTLVGYKEGTNTINATGGTKTVTLSDTNLPYHTHDITHTHTTATGTITSSGAHTHSTTAKTITSGFTLTAQSAGAHTHRLSSTKDAASGTAKNRVIPGFTASGVASGAGTETAGAHTHSVTGSITIPALSIASSGAHGHTVPSLSTNSQSTTTSGSAGYDNDNITAVNIQNPYTVVYMYKRTA